MGLKLADPQLHNIRRGLTARDLSTIDHQVGHNDLTMVGAFCLQVGPIRRVNALAHEQYPAVNLQVVTPSLKTPRLLTATWLEHSRPSSATLRQKQHRTLDIHSCNHLRTSVLYAVLSQTRCRPEPILAFSLFALDSHERLHIT